jgi:hypothetical protein
MSNLVCGQGKREWHAVLSVAIYAIRTNLLHKLCCGLGPFHTDIVRTLIPHHDGERTRTP